MPSTIAINQISHHNTNGEQRAMSVVATGLKLHIRCQQLSLIQYVAANSLRRNAARSSITVRLREQRQIPRYFSSDAEIPQPTIDLPQLQSTIVSQSQQISYELTNQGYFTTTSLLPIESISTLRSQSISLRKEGRYVPSFSEKLVDGTIQRFDKKGVYACEPDGGDYYTAPDLISYIATLLQTLPPALNGESLTEEYALSNAAFNAKLAVTCDRARYPCHIDNPLGNGLEDVRKLTAILYLNPDWREGDGGEIRLFVKEEDGVKIVDLSPVGGRLLLFWSDEIPHEVLPTTFEQSADGETGEGDDTYSESDRYALTVWIPTDNIGVLHDARSKFANLKDLVHFG